MLDGRLSGDRTPVPDYQPFRDPAEDWDWVTGFVNEIAAATDSDSGSIDQVLADHGVDLADPLRQRALRDHLADRLHRTAEAGKMGPAEYMERLSAIDHEPFTGDGSVGGSGRHGARNGEIEVAAAPAAMVLLPFLAAGVFGTAGTYEALKARRQRKGEVPGFGTMAPSDPPQQLPPSRPAGKVDDRPFTTPVPGPTMPPLHPGGGPTVTPEPSPLPDQSDSLRQPTWLSYETKHGHRFKAKTALTNSQQKKLDNFIAASPSREMSQTLAEMADGEDISMRPKSDDYLVNINKKTGMNGSEKDFERIREIHGVPENAIRITREGWPVFVTPDGSKVIKRETSSDGRLTIEIQVEIPDWGDPPKLAKQKSPVLKIRYVEPDGDY
jgi:hypothetical protein